MKKINDFFAKKTVNSILDVGTGTGDFIAVLKEAFPKIPITGIDPNTESLNEAAKIYPEVSFIEMGGERLEFSDDTFDLASISMALHHLPDIQSTFKEMQRVVKPGGWIIVNELFSDNLNPAQETHKKYHHFRSSVDRLIGVSHNETFKKEQILQMVKDSGIDIQIYFENIPTSGSDEKQESVETRVKKMEQMLEPIIGKPEYDILFPQIEEFRKEAEQNGFQSATRVVIVGKFS